LTNIEFGRIGSNWNQVNITLNTSTLQTLFRNKRLRQVANDLLCYQVLRLHDNVALYNSLFIQLTETLFNVICKLLKKYTMAPITLYRIASERRDFHIGFGCCLHYATVIRYATRRKNHSALEVIWKVFRYVPKQYKQANPVRFGTKSVLACTFYHCRLYLLAFTIF
jgi:hypothetical protein